MSKYFWLSAVVVAIFITMARAEDAPAGVASVAVAANFTAPAKLIAADFKAATGDTVLLSFGSSGQFVTQIVNGAPYDVLLSADIDHVRQAQKAGVTVPGSAFPYATGHLVLWSENPALVDDQGRILARGNFAHVAIADPRLAPYGLAAEQFLKNQGLWAAVAPKLVTGTSIAQTYNFIKTGNASLGFVARSQVIGKKEGSEWEIPDTTLAPIVQQAVLLKHGADNDTARKFLAFLKSPQALAVILKFGYN